MERDLDAAGQRHSVPHGGHERPFTGRHDRGFIESGAPRLEHVDLGHVPIDVHRHGKNDVPVLALSQRRRRINGINMSQDRWRCDPPLRSLREGRPRSQSEEGGARRSGARGGEGAAGPQVARRTHGGKTRKALRNDDDQREAAPRGALLSP
jgi:hypothetical protein